MGSSPQGQLMSVITGNHPHLILAESDNGCVYQMVSLMWPLHIYGQWWCDDVQRWIILVWSCPGDKTGWTSWKYSKYENVLQNVSKAVNQRKVHRRNANNFTLETHWLVFSLSSYRNQFPSLSAGPESTGYLRPFCVEPALSVSLFAVFLWLKRREMLQLPVSSNGVTYCSCGSEN